MLDPNPTLPSDAPSLERGASIGRYVVLGLVGRGAMGEVYAAYDPELERKVAVKLLRAQGSDELNASEAKTRLLREAQAIARLSHPNVIVVHDVGSFGDRVFVAMEYVDGNTLGYWLLAGQRSWREVLRVFLAAGRGLAAAHASHLVHRDFKLENVMIGRDGQVRVMDFGLARRVADSIGDGVAPRVAAEVRHVSAEIAPSRSTASSIHDEEVDSTRKLSPPDGGVVAAPRMLVDLDATGTLGGHPGFASSPASLGQGQHSTELTQAGAIVGTPAYMAPEQFGGKPADERSDQFSFCVALYEALYNQRPFAGRTVADLSDNVVRGAVRAPPESTRVPGWLRRVVLRGLRVSPADRWPSMDALLGALQKDPGVLWRRWGMSAGAILAIIALGLAARRQGARESRPTCQVTPDRFAGIWEPPTVTSGRRAAIAHAFRASGQPYATDALAGTARLLDGYVTGWSSMYTESCEATNLRGEQSSEVLDLRTSCLRDRWNELRALSDVLAEPDGQVVANSVKAAAALTPLERCADVRMLKTLVPPPSDPLVRARVDRLRVELATVKALEDAGRFAKGLVSAAKLVADVRATGYQPLLAEALVRLGVLQVHMGKAVEAESTLDEAMWTAEAARHDEMVAAASVEQIYVAGMQNDLVGARRWLRQADAFLSRLGGHDLMRAWMLNNLGTALDAHGDFEEALTQYRSALAIKERVLGNQDPDVGSSLTNLANALMALARPEDALEYSNRGLAIVENALGGEHPDTALQLANRAEILNRLGRYTEAQVDAQRALLIWERELGPENEDLPFMLGQLGEAELGLEKPGDAVAPLDRALDIAEKDGVRTELRSLRFALARALWASGQDERRAIQLAKLAAEPGPGRSLVGAQQTAQDRELREHAAGWLSSHRTGDRAASPVGGRFAAGRPR